MDPDGSPIEEYGPIELDELFQQEFLDSSDSNEEGGMMMIMSIKKVIEKEEEHVLNFKGSIKGKIVVPQNATTPSTCITTLWDTTLLIILITR